MQLAAPVVSCVVPPQPATAAPVHRTDFGRSARQTNLGLRIHLRALIYLHGYQSRAAYGAVSISGYRAATPSSVSAVQYGCPGRGKPRVCRCLGDSDPTHRDSQEVGSSVASVRCVPRSSRPSGGGLLARNARERAHASHCTLPPPAPLSQAAGPDTQRA